LPEEGVLDEDGVLEEDGPLAELEGIFTESCGFALVDDTDLPAEEAAFGTAAATLGAALATVFARPPRARASKSFPSLLMGTATTTERVARPRPVTVLKRISDD
jgi:hypothetical protein